MRIITWNVNGLRACLGKGLLDYLRQTNADIIALQETKTDTALPEMNMHGYASHWHHSERRGHSGTLCLTRKKPIQVRLGMESDFLDNEGRLVTLEYPDFFFVNTYTPNSQGNLERWYYRLDWDDAFLEYVSVLKERKPVVICGDFNVARDYVDIYPENLRNIETPNGFRDDERENLERLLSAGFCDVFRELNPDKTGAYTWWSNRLNKRSENRGWRIDYFVVSNDLITQVQNCIIRDDVLGSDHCPMELVLAL